MHKIDIVVTQHAPLLRYLRELGLADETTTHIEHASISDIAGKHVAGVLPVAMAALCASYTEVPMAMTPADRAALRQGDLSYERMREISAPPKTYYITSDRPWPVVSCFARAAKHAAVWSTFHQRQIGPGTIELESAEGSFYFSQVDIYQDRYRTGIGTAAAHGIDWSPWLDERGEAHRDQSDVRLWPKLTTDEEHDRKALLARALGGLTPDKAKALVESYALGKLVAWPAAMSDMAVAFTERTPERSLKMLARDRAQDGTGACRVCSL